MRRTAQVPVLVSIQKTHIFKLDLPAPNDRHIGLVTIGHFTVVYLVAKPLIWKGAEGDNIVIETSI